MILSKRAALIPLLAVLLIPLASIAGDGVRLGFSTDAQTEGAPESPTLASIKVKSVSQSSPAQAAGLHVGDSLVSANGKTIPGAAVADFMQVMQGLEPGDRLVLMVQRSSTQAPVRIEIIAAAK